MGSIGDVLEPILKFFTISVDSLAQIIQEVLPGSDKIILTLFGALETLITEGPEKAGEFVKEVIGENINEVTSFITEFPNLIKENLGKALKEFLPALVGDLARKFVGGPIGIVKAFFDLLDGIAGACKDGAAFLTKFGKAVGNAASGGGDIASTIFDGIKKALKAVLDMFGKVIGLEKLKKPIQKARDKVVEGVKKLLKKILEKMKGVLEPLYKKTSDDEDEPAFIPVEGQFQSGEKFKITIGNDGEIYVSWNPKCKAKELTKASDEAEQLAKKAPRLKNNLKKSAPEIKKTIEALKSFADRIRKLNWKRPPNHRCPKNGAWVGDVCNSRFVPCNRKELGLKEGETVDFINGFPIFSPWAYKSTFGKSFEVDDLDGTKSDMRKIHAKLAQLNGWFYNGKPNISAAEDWLQDEDLTPHHAGGKTVELICYNLHDGIRHSGGAWELRNS